MKIRVRRLYFDFGIAVVLTTEPVEIGGAIGPGVLIIVVGARLVGVDEPNATVVVLTCATRVIRAELVIAREKRERNSNKKIIEILLGVARKND